MRELRVYLQRLRVTVRRRCQPLDPWLKVCWAQRIYHVVCGNWALGRTWHVWLAVWRSSVGWRWSIWWQGKERGDVGKGLYFHSLPRQVSSVQSLSPIWLFATPWIAACQASLSITNSWSSLRLKSMESVMPSSHLILWCSLLLLPPIPPSIWVFSNESIFTWSGQSTGVSASASLPPKKSQGWSPSEWTGWISMQSKGLSRVFSNTTVQKHQFFGAQPSSQSNSHIHTWPQEKP